MTFLHYIFTTHHFNQVYIPLCQFYFLFFRQRVRVNNVFLYLLHITAVGTYHIFHLPHIYKVFGYIILF